VPLQDAGRLPDLYAGLRREVAAKDELVIPHAHMAADWNQSEPEMERLAEIYSMHGTFEWFGNRYLRKGWEVGFVGASDDHRAQPGAPHGLFRLPLAGQGGLAAALAPEKTPDAVFDALRSRSTYATSGVRILLDAKLNGKPMGTRQADAKSRRLECRVNGTAPIDRIDVVRNGEIVWSRYYLGKPLTATPWVLFGLESSSEVYVTQGTDSPRPFRRWKGTLDVEGARVAEVLGTALDNVILDQFEIDRENPNRVRFNILTRGRRDGLLLRLDGASSGTTFKVALEATKEEGLGRPETIRPAADLPAESLALPFVELADGRLERELHVGPNTDRMSIEIVDRDAALDRVIEYTDIEGIRPADYYYVRVTQLDGGRAWSSPFWVGGSARSKEAKDEP
jgi:hypothetical protein